MSRRNRDLAGLAALGALGFYMARGGKKTPEAAAATPVEDRRMAALQAAAAPAVGAGAGMSLREDLPAGMRRNTETGELYSLEPSGMRRNEETGELYSLAPMAAPARRPAGPARSTAMRDSAEEMAPTAALPQEVPSRGRRELPPRRNVAGDYTRRMGATADEMAALSPRRNVAGDYTRRMGATADEIAAYRTREITPPPMTPEMRRQAEAQALERVTPEEMLIGGPGLKGLHAAAKGLANRPPALREVTQQALPAPTARLTGPSKKDLMARDRAARDAMRREEMLQENARRYGLDPSAPGYEGAARAVREGLGDGAFTLKKKGGMVKAKAKPKKMASGGSTSSASKRGDGIASRGKTKCKMY